MKTSVLALLLLALATAGGLSLLASSAPDGLEHTLEQARVEEPAPVLDSPMPDYQAPLPVAPAWRQVVAGVSGTLAVAGLLLLLGRLLGRSRKDDSAPPHG